MLPRFGKERTPEIARLLQSLDSAASVRSLMTALGSDCL